MGPAQAVRKMPYFNALQYGEVKLSSRSHSSDNSMPLDRPHLKSGEDPFTATAQAFLHYEILASQLAHQPLYACEKRDPFCSNQTHPSAWKPPNWKWAVILSLLSKPTSSLFPCFFHPTLVVSSTALPSFRFLTPVFFCLFLWWKGIELTGL